MSTDADDFADDRLVGAEAIAAFRREPLRRTRYLLSRGVIPHGYEGRTIVASKAALREAWRRTATAGRGGSGEAA